MGAEAGGDASFATLQLWDTVPGSISCGGERGGEGRTGVFIGP